MSGGMRGRRSRKEKNSRSRARELGLTLMGGGGCPMNLGTHRSRTGERHATGADTEGCAPLDTTATSHGGDKEPCPGLQTSSGTPN